MAEEIRLEPIDPREGCDRWSEFCDCDDNPLSGWPLLLLMLLTH